jgi:tetratricopeptide (TPR) repeat protein
MAKAREAHKKAVGLEEQRLYRAAVEAYSEALDADPKSDAAFLHRGFCSYQLSDNEGAIADFSQSLTLQPNNSRAYLARATAYAASGNNGSAMTDVSEAILRDPRNPDSYLLRTAVSTERRAFPAMTDHTSASALPRTHRKSYLARDRFSPTGAATRAEDREQGVRVNPNSSAGYLAALKHT